MPTDRKILAAYYETAEALAWYAEHGWPEWVTAGPNRRLRFEGGLWERESRWRDTPDSSWWRCVEHAADDHTALCTLRDQLWQCLDDRQAWLDWEPSLGIWGISRAVHLTCEQRRAGHSPVQHLMTDGTWEGEVPSDARYECLVHWGDRMGLEVRDAALWAAALAATKGEGT